MHYVLASIFYGSVQHLCSGKAVARFYVFHPAVLDEITREINRHQNN
jgi:hypothetical protein